MSFAGFKRCPTQFLAALGEPSASSGSGAERWGIWRIDPGPRGERLPRFDQLAKDRRGRAGWEFTPSDFWIEEHGLIMEAPEIPIVPSTAPAARKFVVTGDREITTVLTVEPNGAWKLDRGTLHDVTHLPCRSARYTGATTDFTPSSADFAQFPVRPGGPMPPLPGCAKQDYYVVFVVGIDEASL